MRNKTKGKKAEAARYRAIMASVTKEMAQPRVAESAQVAAAEQSKQKRGTDEPSCRKSSQDPHR